jgi:hypothetical protein
MNDKGDIEKREKLVRNGFVLLHSEMMQGLSDTHQAQSLNRILYLRKKYRVDGIYGDQGYGHTNFELLHNEGRKREDPVLFYSLGIAQNSSFKFKDVATNEDTSKLAKPLAVFLLSQLINNDLFYLSYQQDDLNPDSLVYTEKDMRKTDMIGYQLREYYITNYSISGQPIYTKENDHFIASLGFALLGYTIDFDPRFKEVGMDLYAGGETFNVTLESRMEASNALINLVSMKNLSDLDDMNVPLIKSGVKKTQIDIFNYKQTIPSRSIDPDDKIPNRNRNSGLRNIPRRSF